MNLTFIFLTMAIVSMFLVPTGAASGVDVVAKDPATGTIVSDANILSMCPGPIFPGNLQLEVTNTGLESDTYALDAQLPTGWSVQTLQADVTVGTSETETINGFLFNMPAPHTMSPGLFEIVFTATSESDGEMDQITIPIEVLGCFGLTFDQPAAQELCTEDGGSAVYTLELENTGKFAETISLSTSVTWASLSTSNVIMSAGEKETITVTLEPPATVSGLQTVTVNAVSSQSYASAEVELELDVKACFDFALDLQPSNGEVCLGSGFETVLTIDNMGGEDTFSISGPDFLSFDADKIVDLGTKTETVVVTATLDVIGDHDFTIDVTSEDGQITEQVSGTVTAKECKGVVVIVVPSDQTMCRGETPLEYTVSLKNTGTVADTFLLSTTSGTLDADEAFLEPGKSTSVGLSVIPSGTKDITVTATANGVSDSSTTHLEVENCFGASVTIVPGAQEVCACGSVEYTATLKNTGKEDDTYTYTYGDVTKEVMLEAGESTTDTFTVEVACGVTEDMDVEVTAVSDNTQASATAQLSVTSADVCYGIGLSNGEGTTVDIFQGVAVAVTVSNDGGTTQEIDLSVDGPDWVTLSPESMELDPGEEDVVYVYATPPFGTEEGHYLVSVTSSSPFSSSEHAITFAVGEDGDVVIVPEPSDDDMEEEDEMDTMEDEMDDLDNETEDGGLILNVTFENITGEIISQTDSQSFKTIAVGIITIIIIIILVIRFAILIKK